MRGEDGAVKVIVSLDDGSFAAIESRALYAPIKEAARIAGVSYSVMSAWANDRTSPIPHIPVGRAKKLIRVSAISAYAEGKEMATCR